MKENGKVISKDRYSELEALIQNPNQKVREKLTKTLYDSLGREINNPTPVFINDPEELEKPLTLNGKMLRILRLKQMQKAEQLIEETPEELNDFGSVEEPEIQTEFQTIDLEDPTEPTQQEIDEFADLADSQSQSPEEPQDTPEGDQAEEK